jgi:hypothetical protein
VNDVWIRNGLCCRFCEVQGKVENSFIDSIIVSVIMVGRLGRRGDKDGPVPIKRQKSYMCSACRLLLVTWLTF